MSIGQSLSRLVLTRLVDEVFATGGAEALDGVVDFLTRCGHESSSHLTATVDQALERAWRALEVALADDPFWDRGQVGLAPGDAQAFRQRLEAVLAKLARGGLGPKRTGFAVVETALRQQCLWELRAAREAGVLAGSLDASEWAQSTEIFTRFAAAQARADSTGGTEGELVHALEERGCVGLTCLLTGSSGLPLLVMIARAFVCQGLGRLLRYCLQESPSETPVNCVLVLETFRQLASPRFSAWQPALARPVPAPAPLHEPAAAEAVPPSSRTPRRPATGTADGRKKWTPRRIPCPSASPILPPHLEERLSSPPTRTSLAARLRSSPIVRAGLMLGIVLLLALSTWLMVAAINQHWAEQHRAVADRQRLAEECRRLDEEHQRRLDEERRLAAEEARRQQAAERRRQAEEHQRRVEAEQARRQAEERAAHQREVERKRREEERQARLREEAERRQKAPIVFERALTHAACRRDEQALLAFTEVLELDPNFRRAWTERGLIRRRLGEIDGALEDFSEAIRRNPRDVRAWLNRGELYVVRHKHSLAIDDFNAVLRLEPNNAQAYRGRGVCYIQNYDYERALADETRAIELAPDDPWPYFYRASVQGRRSDSAKALADYSAAIDRNGKGDPGLAPAYRMRGMIRLDRGEYAGAIADLSRAIQFQATDLAARQARGLAYLKSGDWNSAIADLNELIRRDPDNAEAHKVRGQAYLALDDYRKAYADFTRAIKLGHADADTYYLRARTEVQFGDVQEAIFDCNDATARNPYLAGAFYLRGTLLLKEGNRDRGLADRRKAHELNPFYPIP